MYSEPMVECTECRTRYSLGEAASLGMRCFRCGRDLVSIESDRLVNELRNGNGGNGSNLGSGGDDRVAELQLPAHNEVDEEAIGQFISSIPLPLSMEFYGEGDRRVMLVRGPEGNLRYLAGKIQTLWPSAVLKILTQDPVIHQNGHLQSSHLSFAYELGSEPYLPIRTWTSFLRGDPVHTLLATTLGLMADEKLWLQVLVCKKGKPEWLDSVQRRLKVETQRGYMVNPEGLSATQTKAFAHVPVAESLSLLRGGAYLIIILLAFGVSIFASMGNWLLFGLLALLVVLVGGAVMRYLSQDDDPWRGADLSLVRQKVVHQDSFYMVSVRAKVWAPSQDKARVLAERLDNAMSQYSLAGGNRFSIKNDVMANCGPWPDGNIKEEECMWLGPDEVAGLWHPPIVNDQVSPGLVPVRGVEIRSPDPEDVKGFYKIGKYFTSDGGNKPVFISSTAMQHNLFCIGKPGTGKSTLMQHLSLAGMQDEERPAVIVVDPHGDLVNELLGTIRQGDVDRIRILDVGDTEYSLTFNPLDVRREGWGVIEVTNSIVDIGKSLWSEYWGPRMQNPLKRGVQLLVAANELRPRDECLGLSLLSTILNTRPEIREDFMRTELEGSPHKVTLTKYFLDDFDRLTPHFREQIIQPVLSKAYRFEEDPMLALFSCKQSKLEISEIIRNRQVLVINTGMNKYGSEISNFVGSLMINVILRELVRQGETAAGNRVPVMVVIDEFQTFTGVPWAEIIQQMRKYGGRMVLGTQSMASLRDQDLHIPEIILSGVYSLFAFNMNGDDADYISKLELSREKGGPAADTLISLEPYKAYVRLERQDGRLSRPFYFESAPPPEKDQVMAERVKSLRAEYSFPVEIARQKAVNMMTYFDQYGAKHMSTGSRNPKKRSKKQKSSDQASSIITAEALNDAKDAFSSAFGGPPWAVEADKNDSSREEGPSGQATETLLGKQVDEDWAKDLEIDQDEGQES